MSIVTTVAMARRRVGALAALLALLVLGACGGAQDGGVASAGDRANPPPPVQAPGAAPQDEEARALDYAQCMRDNGVDMPDPGPGQQGLVDAIRAVAGEVDRATMRQALATCQEIMPQYASPEQHTDDVMLALAECLREQGLEVSDSPFDDAHSGAVDTAEFSAAMEVCRDVLTGGGS